MVIIDSTQYYAKYIVRQLICSYLLFLHLLINFPINLSIEKRYDSFLIFMEHCIVAIWLLLLSNYYQDVLDISTSAMVQITSKNNIC